MIRLGLPRSFWGARSSGRDASIACSAVLLTLAFAGAAEAQVAWQSLSLDQALAEATRSKKTIMIDVWAEHCGQCKQMEIDVWGTPAGAKLTADLIPLQIDSTTPAGHELMNRYPVTGLPCVLFIRPDGSELDRVQGYMASGAFLSEANMIARGMDRITSMEAQLSAHPDSLPLMLDVLELYLNRQRDADAKELLTRIMEEDSRNARGIAERALGQMARYQNYFRHNDQAAWETWKTVVERFPTASSIGGAVDGSYRCASGLGQLDQWKTWLCGEASKNPNAGQLNYTAAVTAYKYRVMDPCLAVAARNARKAGVGGAKLDTIAIEMEKAGK